MRLILVAYHSSLARLEGVAGSLKKYQRGRVAPVWDVRRKADVELPLAKDFLSKEGLLTPGLTSKQVLERADKWLKVSGGFWMESKQGLKYFTTINPIGEWDTWELSERVDVLEDSHGVGVSHVLAENVGAFSSYMIDGFASDRQWVNTSGLDDWDDRVYSFILRQARFDAMLSLVNIQ